ncbi:hypothetical protein GCM10009642_32250 [Nocardiopsis metallicus]
MGIPALTGVDPCEEAAGARPDERQGFEGGGAASTVRNQRTCEPEQSYPPQEFAGEPAGEGFFPTLTADRSGTAAPVNHRDPQALGEPNHDATPSVLRPDLASPLSVHGRHTPPTDCGVQRENSPVCRVRRECGHHVKPPEAEGY